MRPLIVVCVLLNPTIVFADDPGVRLKPEVVYGHKEGLAMAFDVFTPTGNANGVGILFIINGGWHSHWAPSEQTDVFFNPLADQGFAVFAIRHGSSPHYSIPDAVSDVRRSVRYIRHNDETFNIDSNRLEVFGMGAVRHRSLVLATTADEGNSDDKDTVGRISDRVQAVVAYVAPADQTIIVQNDPQRFPADARYLALDLDTNTAESHSLLRHVAPDDAPTLLLVGAKDKLVPVDHSRKIQVEFDAQNVPNNLIVFRAADTASHQRTCSEPLSR